MRILESEFPRCTSGREEQSRESGNVMNGAISIQKRTLHAVVKQKEIGWRCRQFFYFLNGKSKVPSKRDLNTWIFSLWAIHFHTSCHVSFLLNLKPKPGRESKTLYGNSAPIKVENSSVRKDLLFFMNKCSSAEKLIYGLLAGIWSGCCSENAAHGK